MITFLTTSLRTARSNVRPIVSQQQCRALSLLYLLQAKVTLGAQAIRHMQRYKFTKRNILAINVLNNGSMIPQLQMSDAAKKFGGPGILLQPVKTPANIFMDKITDVHKASIPEAPAYRFVKLRVKRPLKTKFEGKGKALQFTANSANTKFFTMSMWKAWHFLTQGMRVEIVLHGKTTDALDAIIRENPHLHPESMLEAMPAGSTIMIVPFRDMKTVRWVMGPPVRAIDKGFSDYERNHPDCSGKISAFKKKVLGDLRDGYIATSGNVKQRPRHGYIPGGTQMILHKKILEQSAKSRKERARQRDQQRDQQLQEGPIVRRVTPWTEHLRQTLSEAGEKEELAAEKTGRPPLPSKENANDKGTTSYRKYDARSGREPERSNPHNHHSYNHNFQSLSRHPLSKESRTYRSQSYTNDRNHGEETSAQATPYSSRSQQRGETRNQRYSW